MNCFPLFNTVLLVYSGLFLMNSLSYLKQGDFYRSYKNTILCIILGFFFILVQFKEYTDSYFSFNDSCYGSIFFLLTGFHGFHVIIGLIFLLICAYRLYLSYRLRFNFRDKVRLSKFKSISNGLYLYEIRGDVNERIQEYLISRTTHSFTDEDFIGRSVHDILLKYTREVIPGDT